MFFIANTAMNVIGERGEALFFCKNRFYWLKPPKLFETRIEVLNHFLFPLIERGAFFTACLIINFTFSMVSYVKFKHKVK